MKHIFITLLLTIICVGCSTKTVTVYDVNSSTNSKNKTFNAFNDERYVWESWTFSTNKVNNLK